jgi:hypothetical protein
MQQLTSSLPESDVSSLPVEGSMVEGAADAFYTTLGAFASTSGIFFC